MFVLRASERRAPPLPDCKYSSTLLFRVILKLEELKNDSDNLGFVGVIVSTKADWMVYNPYQFLPPLLRGGGARLARRRGSYDYFVV